MAQFTKGTSGNPAGKPPGSKDKRTELRELLRPHAGALIERTVALALAGDTTALKLCLDRLCPALKPQSEPITLNASGNDVTTLAAEVFRAATTGEVALDEAAVLTSMLLNRAKINDIDELRREVIQLKESLKCIDEKQVIYFDTGRKK